jgi:hypothetical protein
MAVIDAIFRSAKSGDWEMPTNPLIEDVSSIVSTARISPVTAN